MIDTAIVVLHYENEDLTNQCVDSIRAMTELGRYHIVIVDNASPTVYKRDLIESQISVIRNDNNGSVSGMNFGFYHPLYKLPFHIEYVVNFDNDIICMENWLPPLIDCMESNKDIGIVGGKQWTKDEEYFRSVGWDLIGGKLYGNYPHERMSCVWIQGSFVMIRAEMMKMIGMHDERFHTICSDSDYCIHAIDRGWIVAFEPESNVIHIGGASYGGVTESGDNYRSELIKKLF